MNSPHATSSRRTAIAAGACLALSSVAVASAVPLAPPTAYRSTAPIGVAGVPYPATSLLHDPVGVASDGGGGAWIAEGAGRRIQYMTANGPVAEIGAPGRLDGLPGVPVVRYIADVAVVRAPNVGAGWGATPVASATWLPTNTPAGSATPTSTSTRTPTPRPSPTVTTTPPATKTPAPTITPTDGPSPTPAPTRTPDPFAAQPEDVHLVWYADPGAHIVVAVRIVPGRSTPRVVGVLGEPDVPGADAFHLSGPTGVALDERGFAYVADTGNHRLLVVDWRGAVVAELGAGRPSTADTGFSSPERLAYDEATRLLFVADTGNHRVLAYDVADPAAPTLRYAIGTAGVAGDADGVFAGPSGLGVDDELLLVADRGNDRIQVFTAATGRYRIGIDAEGVTDVDLGELDIIYAAPERQRVVQLDRRLASVTGGWGADGVPYPSSREYLDGPVGVAAMPAGAWLSAERGGRVLRHDADGRVKVLRARQGVGREHGVAVGVAARVDGWSAVLDAWPAGFTLFDPDGDEAAVVALAPAPADGPFPTPTPGGPPIATIAEQPLAIAMSGQDRVLVADGATGRVRLLALDGQPAADLDGSALMGQVFASPRGIAISALDGRIAVADAGRHVVEVFGANGDRVAEVGTAGAAGNDFAQLRAPHGVAFAPDGSLIVADAGNHRIQVFDVGLTYRTTLGGKDDHAPSGLRAAAGAAADRWGVVAVADAEGHVVRRYAPVDTTHWRPEITNGYGSPETAIVGALAEHEGALHAATDGEGGGAALWRTEDRSSWTQTMRGGFGDASNGAIHVLHSQDRWLYAGTESIVGREAGALVASRGAGLYRSQDGDAWTPVTTDGFGENRHYAVSAMAAHEGALYAALASLPEAGGARVLRSSAGGDAGTWAPVGEDGMGSAANHTIGAMAVFSDSLHAGVCPERGAPQVWRLDGGTDEWEPAGTFTGAAPAQSAAIDARLSGDCVTALEPFEGGLFAMIGPSPLAAGPRTNAPVSLWRCCEAGGPWAPVTAPDFGEPGVDGAALLAPFDSPPVSYLYAVLGGRGGLLVQRSTDGLAWEPLVDDGFGDDRNRAVSGPGAWARFADRLYVGTENEAHGGELWSTGGSRPQVSVPTKPVPVTPTPRPTPQPLDGPMGYEKVDQWPVSALDQPADVLGNVVDLAVDADGIAYLSDEGLSRVTRLAQDGTWLAPLGVDGPPQVRLGEAGPVAVDAGNDRVYVGDLASDRIVVMQRDGEFVAEWPNVHPADMAVDAAGRLWVADRYDGGIRRYAADGTEELRYGRFGFPRQAQGDRDVPDRFAGFASLGVDADGKVYVGHQGGAILRRYRQEAGTLVIEDSDLLTRNGCAALRIAVQRPGDVVVESDGPPLPLGCVLEAGRRGRDLPTAHRSSDVEQIRLRATDPGRNHAVAMAIWQPAPGMGAAVQQQARPAVLRYADTAFRALRQVDRGRDLNNNAVPVAERILDPVRISGLDDGSLTVNDTAGGVRRFTADGRLIELLPGETYPDRGAQSVLDPALSVATGDPGFVIGVGSVARGPRAAPGVLYGDTVLRRRCQGGACTMLPYINRWWSTTLPSQTYPPGLNALSVDFAPREREFLALQLYRDNPSPIEDLPARILRYPLDRGGRRQQIDLPWGDRLALWVDIDVGTDGRLYVLDTLNDWVQIHRVSGELVDKVRVPTDAWRIAGGPDGDLFLLTTHAEVVRLAPDGTERARFKALPRAGLPDLAPVDIAVDADGWVYVLDGFERRVTVFAPAGLDTSVDVGPVCAFAGDKWADPTDLPLGDTTTLELLLAGSCGEVERPADVVMAVAIYPRSNARPDPTMTNLRVARQVVAAVDFARHRLGIVVYSSIANVETKLTEKAALAVRAITSVKPASRGQGNDYVALRTAKDLFTGPPDRNKVLILVAPFGTGNDAILDLAEELQDDDITILAVNGNSPTVSSELLAGITVEPFGAGTARPALRRLFRRLRPPSLVATGVVTDTLPANMDYVPGSAVPAAAWDAASRTLTWDVSGWPEGPAFRASVDVRPSQEGRWPTNVEAGAGLVDGWGNPASVRFPVPYVRVYGEPPPSATPRPTRTPTPTPTPLPTREPTPVPTSEPGTVYLPLTLRTEGCKPEERHADAVVVLDTSGSMSAPTTPGGPPKLDAARDAAQGFLSQLAEGRDQAALVQFNGAAEVLAPLGPPSAALAALGTLTQASGTRLDLALEAAEAALNVPTRDPRNNPVLVLLTDGEPNGVTPDEVRAVATRVKAGDGRPGGEVLVFTIGLGTAVDAALMADVASRPTWYFPAPDTADLARIYGQIVFEIPCEPDWP